MKAYKYLKDIYCKKGKKIWGLFSLESQDENLNWVKRDRVICAARKLSPKGKSRACLDGLEFLKHRLINLCTNTLQGMTMLYQEGRQYYATRLVHKQFTDAHFCSFNASLHIKSTHEMHIFCSFCHKKSPRMSPSYIDKKEYMQEN